MPFFKCFGFTELHSPHPLRKFQLVPWGSMDIFSYCAKSPALQLIKLFINKINLLFPTVCGQFMLMEQCAKDWGKSISVSLQQVNTFLSLI